ncbi:hypothetical protein AHAS_Ahas13G0267900 [Arachis hypogaea]
MFWHVPLGTHYLFLTTLLFVKPILIRSPLTQTSLLTLSGISAKIESDRKRKKSPVVPAEQKEKHKQHLKKTKKMSSSSNRHGVDGGEVRASDILVKHQGSRRKASWKDPEGQVIKNTTRDSAVSQLKAFHDDIISGKAKFDDIASRFSVAALPSALVISYFSSDCLQSIHCSHFGLMSMIGSYGSILMYKSIERLKPIGKHSLLGASGEISDFQEILRYLDELM